MKTSKKGSLLIENIIFITLNLIFLTILILFIYSHAGGAILIEESYAKNIALLIDNSKPDMEIYLDLEKAFEKAEKEEWPVENMVSINGNVVNVQLTKDSGYSYSFFNDVQIKKTLDVDNKGVYFFINKYN